MDVVDLVAPVGSRGGRDGVETPLGSVQLSAWVAAVTLEREACSDTGPSEGRHVVEVDCWWGLGREGGEVVLGRVTAAAPTRPRSSSETVPQEQIPRNLGSCGEADERQIVLNTLKSSL